MKNILVALARKYSICLTLVLLSCLGAMSGTAAAQNGPHIYLQDRQAVAAKYEAVDHAASLVASGQVQPRALTSGDFDEDGVADLVAGYATAQGGVVVIHRGNLDAFAPQSQESWQAIGEGRFPAPFVPSARAFQVPLSPDFVAAGNFTGRGHLDLMVASRSVNAAYVLAGDGHGEFAAPQILNLPGMVTAMGAGGLGVRQPFPTLVVGVSSPNGSSLLLYRGSRQGLKLAGKFSLNGPASSVVFGNVSGASEAVVLSNGQVFIVHPAPVSLEPVSLPVSARALALGTFIYDRDTRLQMALLDSLGNVHIAAHDSFDPRPYSVMERRIMQQGALRGRTTPPPVPTSPGWQIVESFSSVAPFPSSSRAPAFFRTRLSGSGADAVAVFNSSTRQMAVISHPDVKEGATTFVPGQVSTRNYSGSPVAALPLRTNIDGRPGIVALHDAEIAPSVMMPLPDPTFTVNTTSDTIDANPGDGICADVGGFCSLRAAIMEANATSGTDTIMIPAGTFTLTLPRISGDFSANQGTLDVTDSVNIIGAGQNSTIIQAGTTNNNGVDKVFSFNQDISVFTHATVSLSSLTIQFGLNRGDATVLTDGYGGAFDFDTGASGTANLTLTSCTITDNSTSDGDGGGIAIFNLNGGSGFATISNSIIQNNTVQESSTGGSGIGGGIFVAAAGAVVLSNTQILNNNAVQPAGQGGGMYVFGPSGPTQTAIHGSTISGNHATAAGGGILTTAGLLIDGGTVISGNLSGGNGGGLWHNTINETTTISKATITGNTATGNGGGIQVDSSTTGNNLDISFSRIAGNSAGAGSGLNRVAGTVTATNNWWGTNSPANVINGAATFDPFIVLTHTASPAKIRINQSSTLTGDMSKDNHGSGAALALNLDVLVGLPITFDNPVLGSIPQAQPETLNASAQATATFNAGGVGGNGHANATVDQQTTTANITVLQPPSIVKSFNPTTVTVNAASTVTFAINNGNTVTIDSSFTDTLPTNLVVATTPGVVNNCGGTVTAIAGSGSISFANAALAVGTCTIQVNVQSAVDNIYSNSVTIASTDAGNGNSSSANLTVIGPPSITKVFGGATVPLNGTTSLSFTLTSSNVNLTLNGVAFTDNLPAGLVVATPGNLTSTCRGTATAVDGSSSVSLSGASLAPGASCTVSLNVTGTTSGVKNNSVQVSSTNGGTGNTSNASIAVVGPPVIIKAFGAASLPLNGSTSLTFTIQNNNTTTTMSGIGFSDTLPAGLVVSTPNGLTGSCGGGTITATAGANVVSLASATLAQSSSCTFSVNVTGTTAGTKNNTTGNVTSTEGGTGGTASASINAVAPPSIAKAFGAAAIPLNGTTSLSFTLTNPAANAVAETGVAFTDTLPAGLVVATPNGLTNTCGGTATAVAGSGSASLTGATIAASSTCTLTLNVTGTASGNFTNTTGAVSSTNGGTGNTATANLSVATPPTITKAFGAATIPLNGSTSLTFTLTNPVANTIALTGVAFTDNLPAGLVIATPSGLTSTCGGTATAVAGAGSASLSGGTLAVNTSCTIAVNITGTTAGVKNNSVQVTSTEGGTGNTSNASITVAGPPVIIKAFGAASLPLNGSTSLTFTIQNNNTTTTLGGIGFSDTLPAGLVVSTPNGLTGSCGGGTITATAGANVVSLAGASLAQSTSCTFSVNVTGTAAGTQNNTTGAVTSTQGGTGGTASASLAVVAPPSIAKAFGVANLPPNGTTTLSFTITNPAANAVALTGLAFSDTFPAGLVVATPNGLTNTCGGTATAVAGSGSSSLTGGTVAASSSCTVTVNVTTTLAGTFVNTTGAVTSTNGGTGNTASATLSSATAPTLSIAFGAATIPLNGSTTLSFTVTNPPANGIALTGVGFVDNLPAGLVIATPNGVTGSCGSGTITAAAGSSSLTLAGGTLAVSGSCTFSVNVTGDVAGVQADTSGPVSSTESGPGATSNTATVTVVAPPSIAKAFGAASVSVNGTTSLTFTIDNPNSTVSATSVAFSDTLPAGLVVDTPNGVTGSCGGGAITAVAGSGSVTLSGATIASSSSCVFSVNVKGVTAGTKVNTTGNVTSGNGGTGNTASASLDVLAADLSITKTHTGNFTQAQTGAQFVLTVTNNGTGSTSGTVTVTDTLPSGLTATAMSGTGWTCTLASLNCTRSDVLATGTSYSPITLTVTVASSAPASVTNSATVSGGAEVNTANDTATDAAAVSGFTVVGSPASVSVKAGNTASYSVVVTSQGPQMTGNVTLSVSGLPAHTTATLLPSPVALGATPTTSTLTITTTPGDGFIGQLYERKWTFAYASWVPLLGSLFLAGGLGGKRHGRKAKARLGLLLLPLLLLLAVVSGCGTGSNGFKNIGTPVGTYHLTITASSGAIQQTTNVILVVK